MPSAPPASRVAKEVAFAKTEYDERIRNTRVAMANARVDCLLVTYPPNVCYLTGFEGTYSNWYTCLVVPADGPLTLQACEYDLALLYAEIDRIDYVRWDTVDETAIPQLVKILTSPSAHYKRIGVELRRDGWSPHLFAKLRDALADVEFTDLSNLVLRQRRVKSQAEIEYLRKAGALSVAGFNAATNAITPGCSENDVAAAAMEAMIRAGSEAPATSPFIRAGARSSVMHATWRRHRIESGAPVILEIGAAYQRYTAPVYGTAVIGEPPQELVKLFELCQASVDLVRQNLRPGRTIADVARAASQGLQELSSDVAYVERYGYSIGIGFPPDWVEHSLVIAPEYNDIIQVGMVFHTPRSFRVAATMAAGYSDTVLVTEEECEILTPHARELIVI